MESLAFVHDKEATETWLKMMHISGYSILEQKAGEFSVSVDNNVHLSQKGLTAIPVQFARVKGFNCNGNKLKSLKGSPRYVEGMFDCSYNKLVNLEGTPIEVSGNYKANHNQINTLAFLPKTVWGSLYLSVNRLQDINLEKLQIAESIFLYDNPIEVINSLPNHNKMLSNGQVEALIHLDKMAPFSFHFLSENPQFNLQHQLNKFSVPYEKFIPYIDAQKLDKIMGSARENKTTLKI